MYKIPLKTSNHSWSKKNLVTITTGKRSHDLVFCDKCGIKGKRYNLAEVEIDGRYSEAKVLSCPFSEISNDNTTAQKVKVIKCDAFGKAFANMTKDSEHDVVTPPDGYQNDHKGVWVMGVGEPIKLLNGEYTVVSSQPK